MPRAASSLKTKVEKPLPFQQQLKQDEQTSKYGLVSQPGRRSNNKSIRNSQADEDEIAEKAHQAKQARISGGSMVTGGTSGGGGGGKSYVDPKLSRNILRLAREQQDELEREEAQLEIGYDSSKGLNSFNRNRGQVEDDEDDEDGDMEQDDGELSDNDQYPEEEYEEIEIDEKDRELLERFREREDEDGMDGAMGEGEGEGRRLYGNRTLADLIMDKIDSAGDEKDSTKMREERGEGMRMPPGINPKVIEVYTKVGDLLSRYKSGPLPKAFKIIPSLPSWESILYITDPSRWTPHATLAATRIFVSNLKAAQTQRFFKLILLDKVRDEIAEEKKLSYQLYEALKKALYKPAAFFKGLLFPLCESGTLTLKEAAIISSILVKVSVPVLHSAAALLRLCEMEYNGPTSLFIRVLLDKKYALPYKVVDALVYHFLKFSDVSLGVEVVKDAPRNENGEVERRMPVLWHQSLLVFAQRYKQDLTPDQKTALLDLLRVQRHEGIGPEVRRELSTGAARGEMLEEPLNEDDDAMSF